MMCPSVGNAMPKPSRRGKTLKRSIFLAAIVGVLSAVAVAFAATNYDDVVNFRGGVGQMRRSVGTTFTAADPNPSRATLRANQVFLVDTTANAVDLDFSDNADLEAADIGTQWTFIVSAGGTNALTITDGASGVVVKRINSLGTTCEDVGDHFICTAYATEGVTCNAHCAD